MNHGLPYFRFFPADFLMDEKVESMSVSAVGAYIRLLCRAWTQDPPATLPDDDAILARMAGLSARRWKALSGQVRACFVQNGGRLVQKRLRAEYESANVKSEKSRIAAQNRWNRDADALRTHCGRIADAMPSEQSRADKSRAEQKQTAAQSGEAASAATPGGAAKAPITEVFAADENPPPAGAWGAKRWGVVFDPNTRAFVWLSPTTADRDRAEWALTYPAVNIDAELRKAADWCVSSPRGRKSNYRDFLRKWLTKAQDQGGNAPRLVTARPAGPDFTAERESAFARVERENAERDSRRAAS